ncbi:YopX family protein [Paenibacillus polymyxa]|uniref:YopX family protein n=1 Tax=Paenibacillus polymyxa TaxID=1406 RepID=UPI003D2CE281
MRDIKFRGISVERLVGDNQWLEGFGVDFCEMTDGTTEAYLYTNFNGVCRVIPETVGQYVNYYGIEFYNGDIMLIACDCDSEYGCTHNDGIYTVVWNKETAGYALKSQSNGRLYALDEFGEENVHIAGNIHDNPELLQGANKLG